MSEQTLFYQANEPSREEWKSWAAAMRDKEPRPLAPYYWILAGMQNCYEAYAAAQTQSACQTLNSEQMIRAQIQAGNSPHSCWTGILGGFAGGLGL